jgi:hypothetical protein
MATVETMSSGKHHQSPPLDLRFDTSDISRTAPDAKRLAPRSPRVVRIPTRPPFPKQKPPNRIRAGAEDDGLASRSVVAVVTEDAEPIRIHERRDTLEQPPMRRPRESAPPTAISDEPTAPVEAPRDVVAAKRGILPLRLDRR